METPTGWTASGTAADPVPDHAWPVVVGVDGSPASVRALAWAAADAARRDCPLVVVHAWHLPDFRERLVTGDDRPYDTAELVARAEHLLEEVTAPVRQRYPALPIEAVTDTGLPAPALVDRSATAALLVVGADGHRGVRHLVLGSVSSQVVHHAHCPVAIIRGGAPEELAGTGAGDGAPGGPVLVGVDGSEGAQHALVWAAREARRRRVTLVVLAAWSEPVPFGGPVAMPPDRAGGGVARVVGEAVDDQCRRAGSELDGVSVETRVVRARPADALCDTASTEGAAVVVVGSRGRGGFHELLLGSVARACAYRAPCPVVVVHPSDR